MALRKLAFIKKQLIIVIILINMNYFFKLRTVYKDTKKLIFINVFILNIINTCLEVFNIALLLPLFSVVLNQTSKLSHLNFIPELFFNLNYYEQIISIILLIILVYIIKVFFFVFGHYYQSKHVYLIGATIGDNLVKKYLNSPLSYHIYNSSSVMIRNVYKEVNEFIETNIRAAFFLVNDTLILVGILFFLLIIDVKKFLVLIVFSIFIIGLFSLLRKLFVRYGSKRQFYDETRLRHLQNLLKSIREIKIYERENFFFKRFSNDNRENYKYAGKNLFLSNLPRVIIETIVLLLIILFLLYLLSTKSSIEILGLETSILFLAAVVRFIPLISRINTSINSLKYGLPTLNVLTTELFEKENKNTTEDINNDQIFTKDLVFNDVTFSYENKDTSIINNLNFKINKGDLVKIVGKSGSGKTTLTNMIIGFLNPKQGEILVDGKPLKENYKKWISKIGIVSQNIFLFNDTVENNIAFGSQVNEDRIRETLKRVNLNPDDRRFGPLTQIEENGGNLSGGEIQRISIARSLYNDSDLIIFDEPTSNLDLENSILIEKLIYSLRKKKTIVVISHDKELFKDAELTINLN